MELKDILKELRREKGVTGAIIAKELNITKSAYSNYEQGLRLPTYDVLVKLAQIFGVTTDYLLGIDQVIIGQGKIAEIVELCKGLTDYQLSKLISYAQSLIKE